MAVSKCYLCNARLRGGDGKYKEVDERSCRLRREMKKKIAETADGEEKDDAAVSYIGVAAIVLMQLLAFAAGIVVGMLIC